MGRERTVGPFPNPVAGRLLSGRNRDRPGRTRALPIFKDDFSGLTTSKGLKGGFGLIEGEAV